jgi:putative hydrolase of the HAD superfamily
MRRILMLMQAIRVKAVLFDLFETILLLRKDVDYYDQCLKKLYESLVSSGINVSFSDFSKAYFKARNELYAMTRDNFEEPHFSIRISLALREMGYNYDATHPVVRDATMAFSDEFMRYIYPDEDVYLVLQRLHGRYRIGIVSNFAIPECIHKLISIYDLGNFLDAIIISAEINRRKPDPKIFNTALSYLGVAAQDSVFVGDTPNVDIKGAKSVGMKTILIERRPIDLNIEDKPDVTIKKLRDLLEILEN